MIVDHVQFVKRGPFGWIHRNRIRTQRGWEWLTVPVITKGKFHQSILETQINNALPWRRKHWRAIQWHYKKAPFFPTYAPLFQDVYDQPWDSICELNIRLIMLILQILGIHVKVMRSSQLDIKGKATQLIIEMCQKLGADTYLSGVHGKDYLDERLFPAHGINLRYQNYSHPRYPQCYPGDFVPDLSVIDLIFNCGPKSLGIIIGNDQG